jgi:hypothetical protein
MQNASSIPSVLDSAWRTSEVRVNRLSSDYTWVGAIWNHPAESEANCIPFL